MVGEPRGYHPDRQKFIEDLASSVHRSRLYVSCHYLAHDDGIHLSFYYNPSWFWERLPIHEVSPRVIANLERECLMLEGFDPRNNDCELVRWPRSKPFSLDVPEIGNLYHMMGSYVVSKGGYFYFMSEYMECRRQHVKRINARDVSDLFMMTVVTRTPERIGSIRDLSCFKT